MKYLLNVNSRTVHNADSKDGRCKISSISDENKMIFENFEDALNHLPQGNKRTKACTFCLGHYYRGE